MSAWTGGRWLVVTTIGLAVTLIALLLATIGAPVWLRTVPSLLVMLAATGYAFVGPATGLSPALRWTLVLTSSLATDFLVAELLLRLGAFSVPAFTLLLLVSQLVAVGIHGALGRRRPSTITEGSAA